MLRRLFQWLILKIDGPLTPREEWLYMKSPKVKDAEDKHDKLTN